MTTTPAQPLEDLCFAPSLLERPAPRGLAAETTLLHFAIVTWLVDPAALRRHLHPRFEPDCIRMADGQRALVSAVTFLDKDFRFVALPWIRSSFGQTNYRAYVTDTVTGEHVAWFFGTSLASPSVLVPRLAWRLPWHHARMEFDCRYDERARRFTGYRVETRSRWAPALLDLHDSGEPPRALAGFDSLEAGLVLLTHPTRGVFHRSDGALGSYCIWHDRLQPTVGSVNVARHGLLERLGLVAGDGTRDVHSVLLQRSVDFTIYLPPVRLASAAC
jgi:hypothetical protein